eukprot:1925065-Alexandrium_andersonii.AAC.1
MPCSSGSCPRASTPARPCRWPSGLRGRLTAHLGAAPPARLRSGRRGVRRGGPGLHRLRQAAPGATARVLARPSAVGRGPA